MSIADAMGGSPKKGAAPAIKVDVAPVTVEDASARLLKAVHGNDVQGIADALRMAHTACADEYDKDDDGE